MWHGFTAIMDNSRPREQPGGAIRGIQCASSLAIWPPTVLICSAMWPMSARDVRALRF
jgi:hypothetical protein